jgi:hypothetical protein
MDNNLIDCIIALKRYRQLQYDADFEDRFKDLKYYKKQADYFQRLVDNGVEYSPKF